MTADVAVIGGGVSGLAAGVDLALSGKKVLLCEQTQKLGGRCYSFHDETTGDEIDNGQHVLVGAYHHTLRYLSIVGTRNFLSTQESITIHHPLKGLSSIQLGNSQSASGMMRGLLRYKHLSMVDRLKVLKVASFLQRWNDASEQYLSMATVDSWLKDLGQSESVRECFWNPLAISIVNELPHRASALPFARALHSSFFGAKGDAAVMIPTIGQTALYVDGARQLLEERECVIKTGCEVSSVLHDHQGVTGIRFADGSEIAVRKVIAAVPYYALAKILPDGLRSSARFASLNTFTSSPIISLHMWFGGDVMAMSFTGLIGKKLQWVFNKGRIEGKTYRQHSYLSAVISGAYDVVDLSKEDLVSMAVQELNDVFPETRRSRLIHSFVIKEKRATFSSTPENEKLRLAAETSLKNFFLAGDWTDTGLPATIEGAIQSGFRAAELAKKDG